MNGNGEENSKDISEDDVYILIDLLLSHNNRHIQNYLKSKKLKFSGSTNDLRKKLKEYYENEVITALDIISLLDRLEEYGNQHIYLFSIPDNYLTVLRDETLLKEVFERNDNLILFEEVFNKYKHLLLPEKPQIVTINHDSSWFKIRWGVKKEDLGSPIEERIIDEEDGKKYLLKKYLINNIRETTLFQVSLVTGDAELLIHRSRDSNYEEEKDYYMTEVNNLLSWVSIDPTGLNRAILNIENSGEVRTRNINLNTPRNSSIEIASPSKNESINEDPDALNTRNTANLAVGRSANFYWLPSSSDGIIKSELYTRFYSNRFSIYGERLNEEVNYVIRRVRHHLH